MNIGAGYNATYTFAADGTFSMSISGTMNETLHYPILCFQSDASASTVCAGLGTEMKTMWQGAGDAGPITSSRASVNCNTQGDESCNCDVTVALPTATNRGTYSTSGSKLVVTMTSTSIGPDAGVSAPMPSDYCVTGNTLMLSDTSSTDSPSVAVMTR